MLTVLELFFSNLFERKDFMTYFTVVRNGRFVGTQYRFTPEGLRSALSDRTTLSTHYPTSAYQVMMLDCTPEQHGMYPVPERVVARMQNLR